MTKKELVKAILEIEEVDSKTNLMKKRNDELEEILSELKSKQEPEVEQEQSPQATAGIDKEALLEQLKSEMLEELKEQAKAEVEKELKESMKVEEEESDKPVRKKEIDRFEPIPVMNVANGKLVYRSRKTGAEWIWGKYGDVEYIEFQELLTMRSSARRFLDEPFLIVMDDDAVDHLGLTRKYKEMIRLESLDSVFDMSFQNFKDTVEKAPRGIKYSIISRARQKYEEGTLDSMRQIKYLNERFGTDIGQRG